MKLRVLITGGAGFIGTNVSRKLIAAGHEITILDNFHPQIHGENTSLPEDLSSAVRLVKGSVEDRELLYECLRNQDAVVHLAAETGTGQSMYHIARYTSANIMGTAHLCDFIVNEEHQLKSVVVASSRSIYGEGKYICPNHGVVYPHARTNASAARQFDVYCPESDECKLQLAPTDENSKILPSSFYGITKQVQEQMVIMATRLKNISSYALRYQNVFGPGQSLKNPYTGILSIFTRLALQHQSINIFEDGLESRDFVFIDDVANATVAAVTKGANGQHIVNVGSGVPTSVMEVAQEIKSFLSSNSEIFISGDFREGDIRHNYADLGKLKEVLGYTPSRSFKEGLHEFLKWALAQNDIPATMADYQQSLLELKERGLLNKN